MPTHRRQVAAVGLTLGAVRQRVAPSGDPEQTASAIHALDDDLERLLKGEAATDPNRLVRFFEGLVLVSARSTGVPGDTISKANR
jgi:hypothetical protein